DCRVVLQRLDTRAREVVLAQRLVLRFDLNTGERARVITEAEGELMIRSNQVVQAERIVGGAVCNRKNLLQIVQRSKRDGLSGGVCGSKRHWRAGKNKSWSNRARQDRTDRGTPAAVIRRNQRIAARQRSAATTRSEESVRTRAADQRRIA